MNYYLSVDEFHTLAALLGAEVLLEPEQTGAVFNRQVVAASLVRLTQRSILVRDADGFFCRPEIRRMIGTVAGAGDVILVTDTTGSRPQLMCYRRQDAVTVLNLTVERPDSVRLTPVSGSLYEYLAEEGYLPAADPGEPSEEETLQLDGWLLQDLPQVTTVLERLGPTTGERLDSRAILGAEGAERVLDPDGTSRPYARERMERWLRWEEGQ